jgi:hypothetical protein
MKRVLRRRRPHRHVVVVSRIAIAIASVLVAVCACDVRRDENGMLDECHEYVSLVASCLGRDAAARTMMSYAVAPAAKDARAAMRARCGGHRDRMKHACR